MGDRIDALERRFENAERDLKGIREDVTNVRLSVVGLEKSVEHLATSTSGATNALVKLTETIGALVAKEELLELKKQVDNLQEWRWKVIGGGAVLGVVGGAISSKVLVLLGMG